MIEGDYCLAILDAHSGKARAFRGNVVTIILRESMAGEAVAHRAFIAGVNIATFANINNDGLSGIGKREGIGLGFAQFRPR